MIHRLFETPRSHSKSILIFLDEVKHSVNCNYKSSLFFFDFDLVSNLMILMKLKLVLAFVDLLYI